MTFFLDRIEGEYCVFICNGTTVNIPKSLFNNPKEGDTFSFIKTNNQNNYEENENLINKLFK